MLNKSQTNLLLEYPANARMLPELPAGPREWALHPGLDSAELLAIDPGGSGVRQTDFDFLLSQEIVIREGIILLNYRTLQAAWAGK